jgi:hypothetical protein
VFWGPPSLLSMPGHEADHSSPFSVDVKNARSCTSTPAIRLHGVVELGVVENLTPFYVRVL